MKSKTLSKLLTVLLAASVAMTVPVVSAGSLSVSAETTVNAAWQIGTNEVSLYLPREVRLSFEEASARYTGAALEPLAYYGCQVVSGCNYALICRETTEDGTVSLKSVRIYDPNFVNSTQRTGKARFTSVEDFDLEDYTHDYLYPLPERETTGGMYIPSLSECELPANVQAVYDNAIGDRVGSVCMPLAYLGCRYLDDGIDYALLCCDYATVPQPDRYIDVVILHENRDGTAYIQSSCSIFGQRTKFPQRLTNVSFLEDESGKVESKEILLGQSVTVLAKAEGGEGDYEYLVKYKKSNQNNWIIKQDYDPNGTVVIKPGAATDYDIYVETRDSSGMVVIKGLYVHVNKKLENISTISAETIKKGATVKLKASSTGGIGEKSYAFFYKKKSSNKWTTVQNYQSKSTVSIQPQAAVDYDVCIKVKDESGRIAKKYFTVTVKK